MKKIFLFVFLFSSLVFGAENPYVHAKGEAMRAQLYALYPRRADFKTCVDDALFAIYYRADLEYTSGLGVPHPDDPDWAARGTPAFYSFPNGGGTSFGIGFYTGGAPTLVGNIGGAQCNTYPAQQPSVLNNEAYNIFEKENFDFNNGISLRTVDIEKKSLVEAIPIAGTDISLTYSSEYNEYSNFSKTFPVEIWFGDIIEPSAILRYHNWIISDGVYTLSPEISKATPVLSPLYKQKITWDSETAVNSTNSLVTKARVDFDVIRQNSPVNLCFSYLPPSSQSYQTFCEEQNSIDVIHTGSAFVSLYHPKEWGFQGWTISNHHFLDTENMTLYTGYGQKIANSYGIPVNDPNYGNVLALINKKNPNEVFIFDTQGRHLETRNVTLNYAVYKFQYGENNILLSFTDRFNKTTLLDHAINGEIYRIIAPYGQTTLIGSTIGLITKVIDPMGNSFDIGYNPDRSISTFKSADGISLGFSYNSDGELVSQYETTGRYRTFAETVEGAFRVLSDSASYGSTFIRRMFELTTQFSGNPTLFATKFTSSIYDGNSLLVSESKFDIVTMTETRTSLGKQETIVYDSNSIYGFANRLPREFTTKIEESSNLVTISGTNTEWVNRVDYGNPLTTNQTGHNVVAGNDSYSVVTDNSTRTKTVTINGDTVVTNLNDKGQPVKISPPYRSPQYLSYNSNGQLSKATIGTQFTDFIYDAAGNVASITPSNSFATQFLYDANSNIVQTTLPNQDKIKFEYSVAGNITKITTPSSQDYTFELGLGDYLKSIKDPNGNFTVFSYDLDQRLIRVDKPSGKHVGYVYNPNLSTVHLITTSDGDILYNEIDAKSRIKETTSVDNIKMHIDWFDSEVQQQVWTDSDGTLIGRIANFYYNDKFKLKTILINGQLVAGYNYDYKNRISAVNQAIYTYPQYTDSIHVVSGILNIDYFKNELNSGNSTQNIVSFNVVDDINNQLFVNLTQDHDSFGRVNSSASLTLNSSQGVFNSFSELTPQYDSNNRVTEVKRSSSQYVNGQRVDEVDFNNKYVYPPASNNNRSEFQRLAGSDSNPQKRTIASYGPDDKLVTLRGSVHRDYTYTDDGDLKTMTNCFGTTIYTYDVFGNLKKVVLTDGKTIEYKVDSQNRRIKKIVNGATVEYYLWYDQIHLAAILDSNKAVKITYIYGPESNSPSFMVKDGVTYKIFHDPGLGSIRYVVDSSTGKIAQALEYDEYGNILTSSNKDFQPLMYAGGLYDFDTKLIRFGARDFDPTIGRWTVKDPIGFAAGDTNLYAYVGGNPMSYNDSSGLAKCTYSITLGALTCTSNDGAQTFHEQMYSGTKKYRNNPDATNMPNEGPVEMGHYDLIWMCGKNTHDWALRQGTMKQLGYYLGSNRGDFILHNRLGASMGCITGDGNQPTNFENINNLLIKEDGSNTLDVGL